MNMNLPAAKNKSLDKCEAFIKSVENTPSYSYGGDSLSSAEAAPSYY